MSNPAGFGGTPSGGDLLQVGGAMNTINNTFAPQPNGSVVTGLGLGDGLVVAEGTLTAPVAPGTYTVSLSNPMANLITLGTSGFPFWETQAAQIGGVRDLTIVVEAGAPDIYCAGKATSEGCTPEIFWSGTASLTGPDDFHLRAKKAVAGEQGLVFFGLSAQNVPFMNGTLCVGNFVGRGRTVTATGSGACDGRFQWNFRQTKMNAMGLNPGDVVHAQWYFRDTAQPDGTMAGLSDAMSFTINN